MSSLFRVTNFYRPEEIATAGQVEAQREAIFGAAGRGQTITQIGPLTADGRVQISWIVLPGGEA